MIEANVLKNQLTLTEREQLTSGSVNVYYVHFHFSSHWDGLEKVAIFKTQTISINVPIEDDIAVIPWEVTTTIGYDVRLGVCGIKTGEIVLPTIWTTLGRIVEGAKIADAESGDHTPDIYDLILSKIQEFIDGMQKVWDEFDNVYDEIPTNDEIVAIVVNYLIKNSDPIYVIIKKYLTEKQVTIENDIKEIIERYIEENPDTINRMVDEVVNEYLAQNPPGIDETSIATAVTNYLESNPIETLSEDDVNNIIEQYLSNNQVGVTEERVQEMIDDTVGSAIADGY